MFNLDVSGFDYISRNVSLQTGVTTYTYKATLEYGDKPEFEVRIYQIPILIKYSLLYKHIQPNVSFGTVFFTIGKSEINNSFFDDLISNSFFGYTVNMGVDVKFLENFNFRINADYLYSYRFLFMLGAKTSASVFSLQFGLGYTF